VKFKNHRGAKITRIAWFFLIWSFLDRIRRRRKPWTMLQHVQNAAASLWQGPGNTSVVCLSRLMHDDLHWLVIPQRVQYKLAVTVHRCLRYWVYLPDYCVPVSKFLVARCHQLSVPPVRRSTFRTRVFSVADQRSGIHCLIICGIQLLTPNTLGGTKRRTHMFAGHPKL